MSELAAQEAAWKQLLDRMVAARQLAAADAATLLRQNPGGTQAPLREEADVLRWLAREYDLAYTTLEDVEPDRELLSLFPARILLKEGLLPLRRSNGAVEVATSRLFATQGLDTLKTLTGLPLKPVLAASEAIQREMKKRLGVGADTLGTLNEEASFMVVDERHEEDTDLDAAAEEASIIRFVNQVLRDAIELRASDIHLEPFEEEFRIRYRIDGVLHLMPPPPKRAQASIISRLKLLSNMDLSERRIPQDGRIKLNIGGKMVDLRVSALPAQYGESMVMRILDKSGLMLGLGQLGFSPEDQRRWEELLGQGTGVMLVTGPTGSGKTTTLYASLHKLNSPDRKLVTVEDPVEYQLSGINQVQVNHEIGWKFDNALRAIFRQDPDIVMVGEIRDYETAAIAIKAALTGHMVFSTVHTNDAASSFIRLVDIGVKPFMVASGVRCVLAQRLVRTLCTTCKEPTKPTDLQKERLGLKINYNDIELFEGKGCEHCNHTGYQGRIGIYELLVTTDKLRELVINGASAGALRAEARASGGMKTLREDAWQKAVAGITSVQEVLRVTQMDEPV